MRSIKTVVFSRKATYRLTKITDFIYIQSQSEPITLAYQGYSILYRLNEPKERAEVVNIFRENLP